MPNAHMVRPHRIIWSDRVAFDVGPRSRGTLAKFSFSLAATAILAIILFAHDAAKRFVISS